MKEKKEGRRLWQHSEKLGRWMRITRTRSYRGKNGEASMREWDRAVKEGVKEIRWILGSHCCAFPA